MSTHDFRLCCNEDILAVITRQGADKELAGTKENGQWAAMGANIGG